MGLLNERLHAMQWLLLGIAVLGGAALATQAGVNASLGRGLGHPITASFASFLVGGVSLLVYGLIMQVPWLTLGRASQVPAWAWSGGLLGAAYVVASIMLAPKLGASTLFAAVIAGQILASVVLDHFGLAGFPVHPFSLIRAVGLILVVAGVLIVRHF